MPRHIAETDRVIKTAPAGLAGLYERHYLARQISPSGAYWTRLNAMHFWIAGRLGLDVFAPQREHAERTKPVPVDESAVLTLAIEWLHKHLDGKGGHDFKRAIMIAGAKAGFAARTIYRARMALDIPYHLDRVVGERRSVWSIKKVCAKS